MLTQDVKPCQRTGEIKKEGTCFGAQMEWEYQLLKQLVPCRTAYAGNVMWGYRLLKYLDCESSEIAMQLDEIAIECFSLKV